MTEAAADAGTPYSLFTGIMLPNQYVNNVLASSEPVLRCNRAELFEATFTGAGDILSAALAALLANG